MFMLCSYWMDLPRNMKKIWYPQPRFTRRQIHIVLDYIIHVNPPFPCCLHLQPAEGLFVMPHPTAQQAAHPADAANGGPLLRRSGVAPGAGQKKTDAQPLDKGKIGRKNPYLPEKNVVSYGHVLETIQPMKELRKMVANGFDASLEMVTRYYQFCWLEQTMGYSSQPIEFETCCGNSSTIFSYV